MSKEQEKTYNVYLYEDANGDPIYVGRTFRPLINRVREHKVDELIKKTARIKYAVLANEAQMIQYEVYYINLYKPEYNIKDKGEGIPIALPELNWTIYEENFNKINFMAYNLSVLEKMCNTLNDVCFEGTINTVIKITDKYNPSMKYNLHSSKLYEYNGGIRYPITVSEIDVLNNSEDVITSMLLQMIIIWGKQNNIKVNTGYYLNERLFKKAKEVGLLLEKCNKDETNYGYKPVGISLDIKNLLSDYGFEECTIYEIIDKQANNEIKKKNYKVSSSNSVKYSDSHGVIVRGTTRIPHTLIAFDHCPELAVELVEKYKQSYELEIMKVAQ